MTPSTDSEFNIHHPQPLLIVISGPSGAGKDTVMQRMKERGLPFHFVVTATTRPQRNNEVHGRDYWFVSKEEFARMIDRDELIEYAVVYGDYKGIPKQQVREELKRVEVFDYVIVNHEFHLDETVDVIRAIIDAEHHRVKPRKVEL